MEITKGSAIPAGTNEEKPWGQGRTAPLPAYCRVEGVMNRRTGMGSQEFGITFALAMPDNWNGDLLMQGGAGSNGVVMAPLGLNAAGDTPALIRGFAVLSNDTGHKSRHPGFDFDFVKDQLAYLDFAYLANAEVALLAKQIIAQYYGKPAAFSYFSGCSTGGREGMILSQRYPTVFDGIISGDPAMRTGLSNLAIGKWIPVSFNQIAPKDADGRPIITQAITDNDRKLISDAILTQCDTKDGLADGLISDPLGCDFDPETLLLQKGKERNLSGTAESRSDKKSRRRPKDFRRTSSVSGFSIRCGHHRQRSDPRYSFAGPGRFRTRNHSDGSGCGERSSHGHSTARGLNLYKSDYFLVTPWKADLLPWRQRSVVLSARYISILQRNGS